MNLACRTTKTSVNAFVEGFCLAWQWKTSTRLISAYPGRLTGGSGTRPRQRRAGDALDGMAEHMHAHTQIVSRSLQAI